MIFEMSKNGGDIFELLELAAAPLQVLSFATNSAISDLKGSKAVE